MKIAITGHTKGIGKACFDLFNTDNNCIGFSRSNGFDISVNGVVEIGMLLLLLRNS